MNEPLLGLASCRYLEITSCTYSLMGLAIKIRGMNQLTFGDLIIFFGVNLGLTQLNVSIKLGLSQYLLGL